MPCQLLRAKKFTGQYGGWTYCAHSILAKCRLAFCEMFTVRHTTFNLYNTCIKQVKTLYNTADQQVCDKKVKAIWSPKRFSLMYSGSGLLEKNRIWCPKPFACDRSGNSYFWLLVGGITVPHQVTQVNTPRTKYSKHFVVRIWTK